MPSKQPTDDCGEPCGLATLSASQIGWRASGIKSLVPDQATREEQGQTLVLETGVALAGAAVGAAVYRVGFVGWVTSWGGNLALMAGWIVVPVAISMVAWWLMLGKVRAARWKRIHEIYLSMGRCGSCGYGLSGLPTDAAGWVVCPECRAFWERTRIGDTGDSLSDRSE